MDCFKHSNYGMTFENGTFRELGFNFETDF